MKILQIGPGIYIFAQSLGCLVNKKTYLTHVGCQGKFIHEHYVREGKYIGVKVTRHIKFLMLVAVTHRVGAIPITPRSVPLPFAIESSWELRAQKRAHRTLSSL
jgi:hypothetical protein